MQLPEPLQPWSTWLNWFGDDLAEDLGHLVLRLSPLIGRFRGPNLGALAEPDGLGDLQRRGPYERLLSSEWVIADEVPDEFIRRAATGEHLFLAPRPRTTQGQKLILAVFDAGSLQLGAPRLVQLALWILLGRRARELGGVFRWGILQEAPALSAADDPADLRRLLRARSFTPGEACHAEAWQAFLQQQALGPGESWLVSPMPRGPQHPLASMTHQVRALPALSGEGVEFHLHDGRNVRHSVLTLPPARAAQRILKGEFQTGDQTQTVPLLTSKLRLSIARPPVLSTNGSHVAVPMLDDVGVMVFQIPKKAVHRPGKPRQQRWAAGFKPLALASSGRTMMALLAGREHLLFHQFDHRGTFPRLPREQFEAPPGQAAYLPAACTNTAGGYRFYVLDRARRLKFWKRLVPGGQPDEQLFDCAAGVLAMAQISPEELIFVDGGEGRLKVNRLGRRDLVEWQCELQNLQPATEVLLGAGRLWSSGFGACALRSQNDPAQYWTVYERAQGNPASFRTYDLQLPEGWRAIGLVQQADTQACGLVVLNRARDQIHVYRENRTELIHSGAAWITRYAVCPNSGVLALLTNAYQLQVYDLPTRELRLSMDVRGEPDAA